MGWSYNADFVATSETVFDAAGAQGVVLRHDNDLLLTCAAPTSCSPVSADALRLTRHSQHGMVTPGRAHLKSQEILRLGR